jgi:hypothetical protein
MPPPAVSVLQELQRVDQRWADSDGDEQMGEVNVIFGGIMSIASNTQGKKLHREISLAQHIKPGRRMRWSDAGISFRSEDHPDTELSDRNLPFIIKIPTEHHKMAKTLINSGASLNLMMRKSFIEMGLNLPELTPMHDTFDGIIPGQSSTTIGRINLEVSCGTGENKRREMLTFEVASFDIRYKCILGRPFLLKFMAVNHTAYATIKMSGTKGVIILKSDQRDTLACENVAVTHVGRCGEKEAQELATKVAKTHGGGTSVRKAAPRHQLVVHFGRQQRRRAHLWALYQTSTPSISQRMIRRMATDKEVVLDSDDTDKKLRLSTELDAK